MTAPTLVLPGGPAHQDDPRTWTIPLTTPDVHAWREQQHAKRGGLIAAMRLRNAEKFALEQAHRAAQEKAAPAKPKRPHVVRTDTKGHHARWRRMYESGMSTPQIAAAENVPQSTVVSGIKAAGGTTRPRSGRKPTPLDVAAVVAGYQSGAGLRALATRHHTTDQHIRAALVTAGVRIRTAGEIGAANCAKRRKGKS